MTTVIAMYDSAGQGRQAMDAITKAGFNREQLRLIGGNGGDAGSIAGELEKCGIDDEKAQLYARAIGGGRAMVTLEAPEDKVETALSILRSQGSRNLDEVVAELKRQGDGHKGMQQHGAQQRTESIPVVEEEVSIGKQKVQQGGVRATTTVSERPVEQSVKLQNEKVDVERKPTNRVLSPEEANKAFEQKSIEMKETAEQATIHKQPKVTEEVQLKKTPEEREEKLQTTARKTDVKVEPASQHGSQHGGSGPGKQG